MDPKKILIIDPVVSSKLLFDYFDTTAIFCVTEKIKNIPYYYERINQSARCLSLPINASDAVDVLKKAYPNSKFCFVLSGSEMTYEYTEKLAEKLSVPFCNDANTVKHRFDKHQVYECLQRQKVTTPLQLTLDEYLRDETAINFPVIIKPMRDSSGSRNVHKINSSVELKETLNQLDHDFDYIIEQYIAGKEYIVDAVIWNNRCDVINVYYAEKTIINDTPVSISVSNLDISNHTVDLIKKHICDALPKLGFQYGICHVECIVADEKVYIIDLNPRVSGSMGLIEKMHQLSTGRSLLSTLAAHINAALTNSPVKRASTAEQPYAFVYLYRGMCVNKIFTKIDLQLVERLATFYTFGIVNATRLEPIQHYSLDQAAFLVLLASNDVDSIRSDIKKIDQLIDDGLIVT